MNKELLKKIDEAPAAGWMLVYTRMNVIFESYQSINAVMEKLSDKDVLEMHLFDETKEYRMITSRSGRFENNNGIIEYVSQFLADKETVFAEDVLLDGMSGKLTVLNHIHYDEETGMAMIDDARLVKRG